VKIAISTLVTPVRKSGVGNYVINLLGALQRIDQGENEYYIFIGQDTKHLFSVLASNFHPVYLPFSHDPRWLMRPLYYLWQNSLIYLSLKYYQIEVLHFPNLSPLWTHFAPTVVTIPDVAEFLVPKYSKLRQSYRKILPYFITKNSDIIITISNSAREDIAKVTGYSPEKIKVTYLASRFSVSLSPDSLHEVHDKYGFSGSYILHVGGALPHKNVKRVIDAFMLLKKHHQIPHRLLLVGDKGNIDTVLTAEAEQLVNQKQIIFTGYIQDNELVELYKNASVFVFPSLYEGFGLPVLEAMTFGVPVVTSNVSSLPEVAGDAALLVDPNDTEMLVQAILSLLQNVKLRDDLICKGKIQAAKFSWDECARQTLAVYERIVKDKVL
jgi:glycosyltransferase involved in cell wall biosynthesis